MADEKGSHLLLSSDVLASLSAAAELRYEEVSADIGRAYKSRAAQYIAMAIRQAASYGNNLVRIQVGPALSHELGDDVKEIEGLPIVRMNDEGVVLVCAADSVVVTGGSNGREGET